MYICYHYRENIPILHERGVFLKQKYKELVDVAALAGIVLLESHAESYRVEDTVRRILATTGFSRIEVLSNTTGLYITLDDDAKDIEPYTIVRRVSERGTHLNKIYRVNNISRQLTSGQISVAEAYHKLTVVSESEYTVMSKDIGTIFMVVGFTILLGGNIWDVLISFIAGLIVTLSRIGQKYFYLNAFFASTLATFIMSVVVTFITNIVSVPTNSNVIIISALMPLFPGMAFTNGLRDALKGDYISALARIADALVIALSIALGFALGLSLMGGIV